MGSTWHEEPKTFNFDASYFSYDSSAQNFATQEFVVQEIGAAILKNALEGYNGCIFAYGQTGSGKSFSMLGNRAAPGIIPWCVGRIFEEKSVIESSDGNREVRVAVSFFEI